MKHAKRQLVTLSVFAALAICVAGGFSTPGYADKGGNGHGNGHGHGHGHHDDDGNGNSNGNGDHGHVGIAFNDHDRQAIHVYMEGHHSKHCPPGLAKKHNGCLPPGQAKKYEVGQRLPDSVSFSLVPYSLRKLLQPAQPGYEYVRVDDDVLLMSKSDKIIHDAVSLISDLSH